MKDVDYPGVLLLTPLELKSIKGGMPILGVLGAITTAIALGKAVDQIGEWFLEGWNNPR